MTSNATYEETAGTEFLLWATDEEMRAVRVVDLFLSLLVWAARERRLETLHLKITLLHEHFPEFATACQLDRGEDFSLYRRASDGLCPAVNLQGRLENSSQGEHVAWIYYLHFPSDPARKEEEIMKKADRIGMKRRNGTHPDLLDCGRVALSNMIDNRS